MTTAYLKALKLPEIFFGAEDLAVFLTTLRFFPMWCWNITSTCLLFCK